MSQPKINYVISAWGGRRNHDQADPDTCKDFLVKQQEQLEIVPHNITQLTIVHPGYDDLHLGYKEYLMSLDGKKLNCGTVIKVIYGHLNVGLSYGSWTHAYEVCGNDFDYYIFQEDDYMPVLTNFDVEMIRIYNAKNAGLLCSSFSGNLYLDKPYAGTCASIASSSALEKALPFLQDIFTPENLVLFYTTFMGLFSQAFIHAGLSLESYEDEHKTILYYHLQTKNIDIGEGIPIFLPYQEL